jgi:thiamine pyrophosphokinase
MVFFMSTYRAVIFANGQLPDLEAAKKIVHSGDVLFAADAGARHILRMGLLPAMVVGDLDSLPAEDLEKLKISGCRVIRHPEDKDKTDLELTIDQVLDEGYRCLLIVAALGGRLDMILSNISLLTRPDLLGMDVKLDDGVEQAFFMQKEAHIFGQAGDVVSLLPWGGPARQVTTTGLRWPLKGEDLEPFETRSISNQMQSDEAKITIDSGLLLCIHRRQSQT